MNERQNESNPHIELTNISTKSPSSLNVDAPEFIPGQIPSMSSRSRAGSVGSVKSIPLQPIGEDTELSIDTFANIYGFVVIGHESHDKQLNLQHKATSRSYLESGHVEPSSMDDTSSEFKVSMDGFIYDDASQQKLITMNICGCEPETIAIFMAIDILLAVYYKRFDRKYYFNDHEVGRFMGYAIYEELLDYDILIKDSLDEQCGYMDCVYIGFDNNFPAEESILAICGDNRRQLVCFCILQYCWKFNRLPEEDELKKLVTLQTKAEDLFIPENGHRARLNIYISQDMTRDLLKRIRNTFKDASTLYYYLDYSTALQINDKQPWKIRVDMLTETGSSEMDSASVAEHTTYREIVIINFDLIDNKTGHNLYGIVVRNEECKDGKYEWKLLAFMDKFEIFNRYKVVDIQLPQSSRQQPNFTRQLQSKPMISDEDIDRINVTNLAQHKTSRRNRRNSRSGLDITPQNFKQLIKNKLKELANANKDELIPTMKIKDNRHWIEWILIIDHIDDGKHETFDEDSVVMVRRASFGISFKYDDNHKIVATSICFDRKDIENKYKLTGMDSNVYKHLFESFKSDINSLKFLS